MCLCDQNADIFEVRMNLYGFYICGHFEVHVLGSDSMRSDVLRCCPMRSDVVICHAHVCGTKHSSRKRMQKTKM